MTVERFEQRLAKLQPIGRQLRPIRELDIEIPPNAWPRRAAEPRAHQVQDGPAWPRAARHFIHLDPVERFETRVGKRHEALRPETMPPGAVRRGELVDSGACSFVNRRLS